MRYLFLLLLIVAGVYLWRKMLRDSGRNGERKGAPGADGKVANMVRCSHCGTYLPEDDAIRVGDQFFCSNEHRDAGRG
jgi:uncharacterized protein